MASDSTTIMDLPSFILTDILSELPTQTIFNCRCVCKTWLNLLSDPHFAKLHSARAPVELMLRTKDRERVSRTLFLVDLNGDTSRNGNGEMKLDTKFILPKRNAKANIKPAKSKKYKFTEREFDIGNSCNGLLCLCKPSTDNPSVVCNPITGEYITIPKPEKAKNGRSVVASGFGFSPRTHQYKIVRMVYRKVEDDISISRMGEDHIVLCRMAEVYTLGTASWRCIGYAPHSPNGSVLPTFLNGAIHWSCDKSDSSDFIIAFDFDDEKFYVVPPPPHFGMKQKREIYRRPIGVLRGCLCLTDAPSYGAHLDIWVMKDYAVQESWTKEFVISLYSGSLFQPIKYLNNGDILMVYDEQALVSYNSKKRLRYLDIRGVDSKYEAIVHTPNLVLLKDIIMGDNLEVQNVRSRCADSELSEEAETPFLVEREPVGLKPTSRKDNSEDEDDVAGY